MEELMNALKKLGITENIEINPRDIWTVDVFVNGEWFGLWDITKNTFVE
jgi:hypothetical protein